MLDIKSVGRGSTPNNRQTNVGIAYCQAHELHKPRIPTQIPILLYLLFKSRSLNYETPSPYRKASLSTMHSTLQISFVVVDVTNISDGCSELLLKV